MKNKVPVRRSKVKTLRKTHALLDYAFYYIYNSLKVKIKKDHRIVDRQEYLDFCNLFFTIVSKEMMERKAGVCIKGLGYYYNYLVPKKVGVYGWREGENVQDIMYHTDGHMYTMCYIPSKQFRYWSMDNTFARKMTQSLHYRLMDGQRYNGYPHSTRKLR